MRIRKNTPAGFCETDPWASSTYQTGSTTPPKSHNGLIAVLLVLVIVLCGIVTVLSINNIRLFRALSGQAEKASVPITFSGTRQSTAYSIAPATVQSNQDGASASVTLGIQGDSVPKVYQLYYRLPCGLYVQQVDPASSCGRTGLRRGDIITQVDGIGITCPQDFRTVLANYDTGDTVTLTVYRDSRVFSVIVTVEPSR